MLWVTLGLMAIALACALPVELRAQGMAANCTGKMEGNPDCPSQWVCISGQCLPRASANNVRPGQTANASHSYCDADRMLCGMQDVTSSMKCETMMCSLSKPCPNGWMCMSEQCCPRAYFANAANVDDATMLGCLMGDGKPCPDPR